MDSKKLCNLNNVDNCNSVISEITEELNLIQTLSKIGSWKIDLDSTIVECSDQIFEIFEIPNTTEMTYRLWFDFVTVNDRERLHQAFRDSLSTTSNFDIEYRIKTGTSKVKWLRGRADLSTRKGHFVFGTIQDITERKENEESLQRMSAVFLQSEEGSAITDVTGTILDINAAFTKVTGYTSAEVIGQNPRILQSGKQDKVFYERMWNEILTTGIWSGEIWNKNKNGDIYPEHLKIFSVKDKNGEVTNFISLFSDISAVKKHNDEIQFLAYHDPLTGLPNRAKLTEMITSAIDYADRNNHLTMLAFLDLDGFKPINDVYGHQVGDRVLKYVANKISSCIRSNDMCSRIGGDEFVILFSHVHNEGEAHHALTRIIAEIHKPFKVDENEIKLSISIGVTIYPGDKSTSDTLLRHADQAMYQAKQLGKNRIEYFQSPSINSTLNKS